MPKHVKKNLTLEEFLSTKIDPEIVSFSFSPSKYKLNSSFTIAMNLKKM
jgi:hypothetical protein